MLTSYAQNFEDVLLWRALKHIEKGFYVDIGAQHPVIDSVSRGFYEMGWRGVHIEPTPAYAQALRDDRPDEVVMQVAIGDENSLIPFYEIANTGISTGIAALARSHESSGFSSKRIEVPCVRLAALLDNYRDREIHWMKIDVEGMEESALRSWAPSTVRPWIVVIESTLPLSQELSHATWEAIVLGLGYRFAYFDGLNRFYVSKKRRELLPAFATPPNVFDAFVLAGTGSNTFCSKLNGTVEQLQLQGRQMRAEQASQAEQFAQDARALSQRIDLVLQQLEQAKDETVQLLREMSTKDASYAAQLAASHQQSEGLLNSLAEREVLQAELRVQLEAARADVSRLQAELEDQRERAWIRSKEQDEALFVAIESARREAEQREEAATSKLLAAHNAAMTQLAESARQQAAALEKAKATYLENEQTIARARDALELRLRAEIESSRNEVDALRTHALASRAELERMQGSLAWQLTTPLRRLASFGPFSRSESTAPAKSATGTTNASASHLTDATWPRAPDLSFGASPAGDTRILPTSTQYVSLAPTAPGAASSVEELLSLHDEAFVRAAYLTLLGRSPDPSGLAVYLGLVRSGVAKGRIVTGIARSPEGRAKAADLPGLRETKWKHRRRVPSLLGWLLRHAFSVALEPLAMRVRSAENLAFRMHQVNAARIAGLEGSTSDLRTLLAENLQTLQRLALAPRARRPFRAAEPCAAAPARHIYYYVDHTVACPTNTGMQRVARRLADALVKAGESLTFVKWDPERKRLAMLNRDELLYLGKWNGPKVTDSDLSRYPDPSGPASGVAARTNPELSWLLVPEVTHITYQSRPMTLDVLDAAKKHGLKTAFVFYDATPLRRPELQGMASAHATYMQQLMLADLVLPISNWVSADLSAFLRLDQAASVGPTPHIEPIPLPGESQLAGRVKIPEDLTGVDSYLLSVGSIAPHKNQMTLIHAFDTYCQANPVTPWKLRIAGNVQAALRDDVLGITSRNPRISYLGEVDDDALVELYRGCAFTVFPSVMEGYGLPILESLWFGKPCICANFGAMAEVASGGGCVTVDTRSCDELSRAIGALIASPDRLAALAAQAMSRHIDSWQHYATTFVQKLSDLSSPLTRLGHIYYWVDHTAIYDGNTGIQRVTRALAHSLQEQGAKLIPVRWSAERYCIVPANTTELHHLEKWNGPKASLWSEWKPIDQISHQDWLLVPELTHFRTEHIQQFSKAANLRCAWVFYDCIPSKMTDIYPLEATTAHRDYMMSLRAAAKVLAISVFSRDDLLTFLTATNVRCGEIHRRIAACVLPGEFLEGERITTPKPKHSSGTIRLLCVGTVEPRKNQLGLLAALKIVRENTKSQVELVIAGSDPYPQLADEVQQLVDSLPGVRWIRRVDDDALQELYRGCDFTVYPSLEEGFGLPILESLWNARPCVCASFGAMNEVAEGGGCITVDVRKASMLANSILQLVNDNDLLEELGQEAVSRHFKTWRDYGLEVLNQLADERALVDPIGDASPIATFDALRAEMPNLQQRPLLSICISTYNRAAWLSVNLKNLWRFLPDPLADVELLVCDNNSIDDTPSVVDPYLHRSDFTYVRNPENVGMLGNLRVTAHHARGKYIWILGDDDLLLPGTIQRVLAAIRSNPQIALLYLNYSYTRKDKAEEVYELDPFLQESTPVGPIGPDALGAVRDICAKSENFFTAIYCLVFRRDHALRAYSQNTSGRPFSTMLTCIPTTYHVLNYMMDESAYWMGEPQLVVNLNVSWMRYAPLWILERLPEAFDVAERYGGDPSQIDRWRVKLVPHIQHWMSEIFSSDPEGNAEYVSIQRIVNRFKHLSEFQAVAGTLKQTYESAHRSRHPLAAVPADEVFAAFPQAQSREAT